MYNCIGECNYMYMCIYTDICGLNCQGNVENRKKIFCFMKSKENVCYIIYYSMIHYLVAIHVLYMYCKCTVYIYRCIHSNSCSSCSRLYTECFS